MPSQFKAIRVHQTPQGPRGQLDQISLDDLSPGAVTLAVKYSSMNYKDALALTGKSQILRRYPLVAGIDACGVVIESQDTAFKAGDEVVVTGCHLSETLDGGFAPYLRVPGEAVVKLPKGMSLKDSMIIGTAGFTAALCAWRLIENGQTPDKGPILITGASGGVGSVATSIMSCLGYEVWALSGKTDLTEWLKGLGAKQVISPLDLHLGQRPLESIRFGGAIDNVGGEILSGLMRHIALWGNIACVGLASGHEFHGTVMPLILRGVSLLGISSNNCPRDVRCKIWQHLATDWQPDLVNLHSGTIKLEDTLSLAPQFLARKIHGRYLVEVVKDSP